MRRPTSFAVLYTVSLSFVVCRRILLVGVTHLAQGFLILFLFKLVNATSVGLQLQLQEVFVFIVNAFNDETVSCKHVSCAPLKMCLSNFAFIIHT